MAPARDLWYRARTTELLVAFLWSSTLDELPRGCDERRLDPRVGKAMAWLRENMDEELDLPALARMVHASPSYLSRLFHRQVGRSLLQERRRLRVEKARLLMERGRMNVSEAAVEVGYRSLSRFVRAFVEETGMSPGEWLRGRTAGER